MKESLDHSYWNSRYVNNQFGWDVGQISEPLKQYFNQLTNKEIKILIPGAGNAYEAQYLVEQGFSNVYVCDFAEEPLKNLQARCPKIKKENLLQTDFFGINDRPANSVGDNTNRGECDALAGVVTSKGSQILTFDLIIEQTFFCALDPGLRKKYFEKMFSLLKPRAKLVGLLFDCEFEVSPPFGGSKAEYENYFKDLFKVNVYERCYNSIEPRAGRELFINLVRI